MALVFCKACGKQIADTALTCPACGAPQNTAQGTMLGSSPNSWTATMLLALFLGWTGAHRYYNGKIGTGILMLCTLGGLGLWQLIDLINIIMKKFRDKDNLIVMA